MLNELELLKKHHLEALNNLQVYQNRLKRSYKNKIKVWHFQVGNIFLKVNQKNQMDQDNKGKFKPNWLGSFIIIASYGSGAYQLENLEGYPLQ